MLPLLRKRVCYSALCWWLLKTEWELLVPGGGVILGSLLGGTVGDRFSGAVSLSALSEIRVGGETMDAEKVDVDLVLVDRVFLRDWRICSFAVSLIFGRYFWTKSTVKPHQVVNKFCLMAVVYIFFGGHKQHWWRYMARFSFVLHL